MKRLLTPVSRLLDRIGFGPRTPAQGADARIQQLLALLHKQRFGELEQLLLRLPADLQHPAYLALGEELKLVEDWVLLQASPPALLAEAAAHLHTARSQSNALEQHGSLQEAERSLRKAQQLDPGNPELFCLGIVVGSEQGLDLATLEDRCTALRRLASRHYWGQVAMLEAYARRGTESQLFEFARKMQRRSPRGDGLNLLPVYAHLLLMRDMSLTQRLDYARRPEVREEVLRLYRRSLGASQYVIGPATLHQRNRCAVALACCGASRLALREIRQLRQHDPAPWALLARNWREEGNTGHIVDRVARELHGQRLRREAGARPSGQMAETVPG
ncbi:hypothetical protein [Chitinilyticum litopenaei]|uniref:hypothetical protein n=1 Tax=Chitinilyticum litopenaei TaxID=1121276 RepID=UPI0003FF5CA8|nr:hypothetical protein [Chitinilyticum litopenaei]